MWAICVTSAKPALARPVGTVSVKPAPASSELEIGWYLHPDYIGLGYATEAARLLLDRTLAMDVPRLWAFMWPDNHASANFARAVGMTEIGVIHDPWYGTDEEPTSRIFVAQPDR